MQSIDPDTGEIIEEASDEEIANITKFALGAWGDDAVTSLHSVIKGPHYRKKRLTLLKLAEAAYLNKSQLQLFREATEGNGCGSRTAHYKWRNNDAAYETAYQYLVGDRANPGVAMLVREQELDEVETLAISALVEARTHLRLLSAEAVNTLGEALYAKDRYGPLWRERIVAANSILDRSEAADTGKARHTGSLTLVDQAILTVYNVAIASGESTHDDHDIYEGTTVPALPSGVPVHSEQPTLANGRDLGTTHNHASDDGHTDELGIPVQAKPPTPPPANKPTIIDGKIHE